MKIGKKSYLLSGILLMSVAAGVLVSQQSPIKAEEQTSETEVEQLESGSTVSEEAQTSSPVTSEEGQAVEATNTTESIEQQDLAIAPAAMGIEATAEVSVDVANWDEFILAFANKNVTLINVVADFMAPTVYRSAALTGVTQLGAGATNVSGQESWLYLNQSAISRKVTIQGNDHIVDFGSVSLGLTSATHNASSPWDITFSDWKVYHADWWGFFQSVNLTQAQQGLSKITYHNIDNTGSQLSAAYYTPTFISGTVTNRSMSQYTSKFRTNWKAPIAAAMNLEVNALTILENSTFNVSTENSGNILVGVDNIDGNLTLEKNAKLNITSRGTGTGSNARANGTSINVKKGDLILGENAELNIDTEKSYSAISLAESGSNMIVGNNAKVTINSRDNTRAANGAANNPVYMAAGSSLEVGKNASFVLSATGREAAAADLVYVAGKANFFVDKYGTLDLKSDSTAQAQSIINFAATGSRFQFADAKWVNLERTGIMTGTAVTSGLISIAGTTGELDVDIQKVSKWNRDNISATPTASWTPMYAMKLVFSTTTPTIKSASSLTQANIDNFKANFTTKNVQRVLYEYIPDVGINLTSTATDVTTSTDSTTITGKTNPGAYVRLSDVPVNGSVQSVLLPADNKILSPVTAGGTAEFTANFTLQADASGNFSYTLPAGKRFSAGTVITAYSFLNGKHDTATQTVLDKTAPTGVAKEYHVAKNSAVPNASVFVTTPADSNPVAQTFGYQYDAVNTVANIQTKLTTPGTYNIVVNLSDNAGNITPVTSKLVVYDASSGISANNLSIGTTALAPLTDATLKAHILANAGVSSYKLANGVSTDLTSKVQVSNLGGLTNSMTSGDYTVTLFVAKADSGLATDITKTITVTVINQYPDVTLSLTNQLTDLATNVNSNTITGKTSPNAYVRLSDQPINGSVQSVLLAADNKVASPVTTGVAEITSNYTVKANASGDFTYTLPAGKRFSAGTIVTAFSFLNGKSAKVTQTVADKTAPTGVTKEYHVVKNSAVPNPNVFVQTPADTNPVAQTFGYQYNAANTTTNIQTKLATPGTYNIQVDLSDMAGNSTTITSKLTVYDLASDITAKNVSIGLNALSTTTDATLKSYILSSSEAASFKVANGSYTDLTSKIQVSNLGGLTKTSTAGTYTVTLMVSKADSGLATDTTKTITVTVFNEDADLTVEFVNEKGTALKSPVTIAGKVSEGIDLTKQTSVTDVLAAILAEKYQLNQRPVNETNVIVGSSGTTVQYQFKGVLVIDSAPQTIDFGSKKVGVLPIKVDKATYDVPLTVLDNRADLSSWTLTATLQSPLTNQVDSGKILPDALRYKKDASTTLILSSNAQPIEVHKNATAGEYDVSSEWDTGDTGFQLEIPAGGVRKLGDYQATILWQLGQTP